MHQTTIDAEFVELYNPPNIFAHLLRDNILSLHKQGRLKKFLGLKENGFFSPQGAICETWRLITNKGEWDRLNFAYETTSGGRAFAHMQAPYLVTEFFTRPVKNNCEFTKFLTSYYGNEVEEIVSFMQKVGDYKVPQISPETMWQWKIKCDIIHNGNEVGYRTFYVDSFDVQTASESILMSHPNVKIKTIDCIGKKLF